MATKTTGQHVADELRRYFHASSRTRWNRRNQIGITLTRSDILEHIHLALTMPGYSNEQHTDLIRPVFYAVQSWWKHIESGRADSVLCWKLQELSPWAFCAYLGRMVDTGHNCTGQFEVWFKTERDALRVAA